MPLDDAILGHGVYTPRRAARLAGTSPQHVLRWTRGSGPTKPLWDAHFQFLDEDVTEISFLDLVEVRVVAALRRAGISLQAVRFAMDFAQEKYGLERPLASQSFKTDGTEILMDAVEKDGELVSLSSQQPGQRVFRKIIDQSLNDLEFEDDLAARWRPKGYEELVVDPRRRFGDPLIDKFGISTATLKREYEEFSDANYLARIYEIPKSVLKVALAWEQSLDEANG